MIKAAKVLMWALVNDTRTFNIVIDLQYCLIFSNINRKIFWYDIMGMENIHNTGCLKIKYISLSMNYTRPETSDFAKQITFERKKSNLNFNVSFIIFWLVKAKL